MIDVPTTASPCRWRNENIEINDKPVPASAHQTFHARGQTWCRVCDRQTPESIAARTDVKR